jgi:hypothetical protein
VACALNPARPRKGAFVVSKVVAGTLAPPVVELVDLVRPFPPLKALDMDAVIARVLAHV